MIRRWMERQIERDFPWWPLAVVPPFGLCMVIAALLELLFRGGPW